MGLADADLDAAVARFGNALRGSDQGLTSTPPGGHDALGRDAHAYQNRFHAIGTLQGKRIVRRVGADLVGVTDDGDFRRLPARHLGDDPFYFLFGLLGELVGPALEIEGERDGARRHRGQRAAEDILNLIPARGVALHAASGSAGGGVRAVERYVALAIVNEDFSDLAVFVREKNNKVLGGGAATEDQERR